MNRRDARGLSHPSTLLATVGVVPIQVETCLTSKGNLSEGKAKGPGESVKNG